MAPSERSNPLRCVCHRASNTRHSNRRERKEKQQQRGEEAVRCGCSAWRAHDAGGVRAPLGFAAGPPSSTADRESSMLVLLALLACQAAHQSMAFPWCAQGESWPPAGVVAASTTWQAMRAHLKAPDFCVLRLRRRWVRSGGCGTQPEFGIGPHLTPEVDL